MKICLIPIIFHTTTHQSNFRKGQEQGRLYGTELGQPSQCQGQMQQVAMDGWPDTSRVWDHRTGN